MLTSIEHTGNRSKSDSSFSSSNENATSLDRKRLVELLSELRNLLEDYAPSWYTEEQHRKLESALHNGKKH